MSNNLNNITPLEKKIFGENVSLFSGVDEFFELEMAYLEFCLLDTEKLIERSAYFKSIDNKLTKHFLLYTNHNKTINENRSPITQSYFEEGQFSTGYATNGLFPYRGKFHPQLIKGLLNILGIEKGEIVCDPMAGSGTLNIEAALMGINSIACDISPFCRFMIQTKYEALTIDLRLVESIPIDIKKIFEFFSKGNIFQKITQVGDFENQKIYNLMLLAWLDALGYSKRVLRSNHEQLFEKVLPRYLETVKATIGNPYFHQKEIGKVTILPKSEALKIELPNESVDCVITSPPYSFAIDYVENDKSQLEYLGYDTKELKAKLIGLKGKKKEDRLNTYFSDMDKVCCEISRILKKEKYFTMIIGSNTNQTGGIRLEETVINSAHTHNLHLIKSILKPIKGMRNTMKDEYILIFKKG